MSIQTQAESAKKRNLTKRISNTLRCILHQVLLTVLSIMSQPKLPYGIRSTPNWLATQKSRLEASLSPGRIVITKKIAQPIQFLIVSWRIGSMPIPAPHPSMCVVRDSPFMLELPCNDNLLMQILFLLSCFDHALACRPYLCNRVVNRITASHQ